jgi:sporulation protein YlmC with PRC-barrel domain
MQATTGHTHAILASKVTGTDVYNPQGEKIGHIEDIVLDKTSDQIMFAVVGFGGIIGIGEKFHPVPWSTLDYDKDMGGYVIAISKEKLEAAPAYDINDLTKADGNIRQTTADYYSRVA